MSGRWILVAVLLSLLFPPGVEAGPPTAVSADTYRERRRRLAEELGPNVLFVLDAAPFREENGVQDRDFHYLTGLDARDVTLVLRTGKKKMTEVLFLPTVSERQRRWIGSPFGPEGRKGLLVAGVESLRSVEKRSDFVAEAVEKAEKVCSMPGNPAWVRLQSLTKEVGSAGPILHGMRQKKELSEIARLRWAIHLTGRGIIEAMRSARPGMYEYEIAAVAEYVMEREGALRTAFPTIAGSGLNGCILHYNRNTRRTREGELLLLDIGAVWEEYAADVTRTFPVSGRFSRRQAELYDLVLEAQKRAIAAVQPGATIRIVHQTARSYFEEAGLKEHFWHGTSHWLGLEAHDPGDYERPFEPGMVLTVEPGLYLPDEAIGIRIEDVVLVTEDGCEVLSEGIPKSRKAVETLMKEKGLGNEEAAPFHPSEEEF